MLTRERLKSMVSYDPETGEFKRLYSRGSSKRGSILGSLTHYGYLTIRVDGKLYYSHRLAWLYMTGELPTEQIDHENGLRSDNRWENLRAVSHHENHKNNGLYKNNTSGRTGVSWCSSRGKWQAAIMVSGKTKVLGRFDSFDEAVLAREKAEKKYRFHDNHGIRPSHELAKEGATA